MTRSAGGGLNIIEVTGEKMKYFMGIDPGKKGAVGVIGDVVGTWDCPKGIPEMSYLIHAILGEYGMPEFAALEKVGAMPGQGVKSMFSFGENFGAWQGILATTKIPFCSPRPKEWMKGVIPPKADKAKHVEVAQRQFPGVKFVGPKGGKKDGWADALLIARYAQRYAGGSRK